MADTRPRSPLMLPLVGAALLLIGAGTGWALAGRGAGTAGTGDFDQRVHDYIVGHPEVLMEAADALKSQGSEFTSLLNKEFKPKTVNSTKVTVPAGLPSTAPGYGLTT